MIGLEQVWQRLGQCEIWLLKIDTEGAEADILEGAPEAMLGATQARSSNGTTVSGPASPLAAAR